MEEVRTKSKQRSKNFTDREKELLFDIVKENFLIIVENKQTDAVTVAKKKLAWAEITQKYNSVSETGQRTPKQLHALYDNLKKNARIRSNGDKKNVYNKGEETFVPKLTVLDAKIINTLKPQFQPDNRCDSISSCSLSEEEVKVNVNLKACDIQSDGDESEQISSQDPFGDFPTTSQEARESCPSDMPKKRRKYIDILTNRIANRQNVKCQMEKEIVKTKKRILDIEEEIKKRQLEILDEQLLMVQEERQHKMKLYQMEEKIKEMECEQRKREFLNLT